MALSPHRNHHMALERYVPISRSPYSFFDPSWEVGTWHDFSSVYRRMEEQMRHMDQQIQEAFRRFGRLSPISATPALSMPSMSSAMPSMSPAMPSISQSHLPASQLALTQPTMNWPAMPAPPKMTPMRLPDDWTIENPIITDSDGSRKLKLQFDVRQFKPEEITVRTQDNTLTVHARHEERSNSGQTYREYHRQFLLPQTVSLETLASVLSPEGVLSISAPMPKALPDAPRERVIPIEHSSMKH